MSPTIYPTNIQYDAIATQIIDRLVQTKDFDTVMDRIGFHDWRNNILDLSKWHPTYENDMAAYMFDMPVGVLYVRVYPTHANVMYTSNAITVYTSKMLGMYRNVGETFNMGSRQVYIEFTEPLIYYSTQHLPKKNIFAGFIKAMLVVVKGDDHDEDVKGWSVFRKMGKSYNDKPYKYQPSQLIQPIMEAYHSMGLIYVFCRNNDQHDKAAQILVRMEQLKDMVESIDKLGV